MWSSNLFFFASSCFPRFSESRFFRVQVFQGPGFSESRFFWVQVFQGPGFSGSGSRVCAQVLEVASKQVFQTDQQTKKRVFSVVNAGILDDGNIPCSFSKNRQINYNIPPDIYLFKVNNRSPRTMCEICPKLTTAEDVVDSRTMLLTLNK